MSTHFLTTERCPHPLPHRGAVCRHHRAASLTRGRHATRTGAPLVRDSSNRSVLQPKNFAHLAHGRSLCWHPVLLWTSQRSGPESASRGTPLRPSRAGNNWCYPHATRPATMPQPARNRLSRLPRRQVSDEETLNRQCKATISAVAGRDPPACQGRDGRRPAPPPKGVACCMSHSVATRPRWGPRGGDNARPRLLGRLTPMR
jgi:hypothetical protein